MLEYYNDNTAIGLELVILSGGISVTGRNPYVEIYNPDLSQYFDFASNTFTGAPTNTGALLTSAIEGIYRTSWDISGLFNSLSGTRLVFEYHDATSVTIDNVLITPKMRVDFVGGGGGGDVVVKGLWTAKQKKRLLDDVETIKDRTLKTLELLRKLLGKKTLQKEDLRFITDLRKADLAMWTEVLEIFKLDKDATEKQLVNKIKEWMNAEENSKKALIKLLDERIGNKPEPVKKVTEDEEDDE